MRRFLILGHTQKAAAPLPLNDSAGLGGRWDLLARCIGAGLLVSHGIRRDTEVVLALLAGPRIVRVEGRSVQRLNPDERSTVALLSRALEATDVGRHETSVLPGIHTSRRTLADLLDTFATDSQLVLLREESDAPVESWTPSARGTTFVLSDHRDPAAEELEEVRRRGATEMSLGPVALQTDQCLAILHNRLDRVEGVKAKTSPP